MVKSITVSWWKCQSFGQRKGKSPHQLVWVVSVWHKFCNWHLVYVIVSVAVLLILTAKLRHPIFWHFTENSIIWLHANKNIILTAIQVPQSTTVAKRTNALTVSFTVNSATLFYSFSHRPANQQPRKWHNHIISWEQRGVFLWEALSIPLWHKAVKLLHKSTLNCCFYSWLWPFSLSPSKNMQSHNLILCGR